MSLRLLALFLVCCSTFVFTTGCGGKEGGVADAPDKTQQELSPEEEAGEEAYTNSPEYQ